MSRHSQDRPPASEPGLLIYIMVADAAAAVDGIIAARGQVVRPIDPDPREVFTTFRDPGGNSGPSLFTIDISGRNELRVPTPGYASDPAWSPLLS